jgi:hypothetical protein
MQWRVKADRNLLALMIYLPKKNSSELIDPLQDISADSINTSGHVCYSAGF